MNEHHLVVCKAKIKKLLKNFDEVLFEHIARSSNRMADALAVLGSPLLQLGGTGRPIIWFERHDAPSGALLPTSCHVQVLAVDGYKEWYKEIFDYLANDYLPSNPTKARDIRRKSMPYSPDDEEYIKNRISSLEVLQEERE